MGIIIFLAIGALAGWLVGGYVYERPRLWAAR
ncbi:hypothetical protein SAMN05216175_101240 [Neptunomonas qingdaonensis]|uniref:Uncharacterized protein n=1 Tax=Neptunomonas qingdaonensis TaxID=1045558 RepID=A0A1I2LT60_9GAMM|nr:hypothetical protein SAMN05216175_101240 [Neptunomonas qingdaonensis]